jgi:pimeloyl-ACP methyl ester carboxylesterase
MNARADTDRPRPPGGLRMLLEARAPFEYAASLAARPWLARLPRGDGHPVLVLPGFGASDRSTEPLRRFLAERGHAAYGWELGTNRGASRELLDGVRDRLQAIAARHAGERVSLVGWSLGGVYARELAKTQAPQVRCVVTLGSPFAGDPRSTSVAAIYQAVTGRPLRDDPERRARLRQAPPVPTSSIYSRSDGVVPWESSLNEDLPHTENIEVASSHLGMGVHPWVLFVIADRLRQDPARWRRFDRWAALREWR